MKQLLPIVLLAVLALIAGACGPTAQALRPTLPPRSIAPGGGASQPGASFSGGQSAAPGASSPGASGTIPPTGIAQLLTGFQQGNAYEVTDVTVTPAGGLVAVG